MVLKASDIMNQIAKNSALLTEIDSEKRENLQKVLLIMLKDIIGACTNNNVDYCLCAGSVLGAVRHNGFIPWDDDIDLFMMREDWENFKLIFEKELGDKYEMEAPNYGNKDTKTTFGKIYLKNSKLVEIQDIESPFIKGVFIDVFVIDGVSDNKLVRKIDSFMADVFKIGATCKTYYSYPNSLMSEFMGYTLKSDIYYKLRRFAGFLLSWVSHEKWCKWYDKYVSRYSSTSKLTTVPSGGKRYKGEMIEREIWKPYVQHEFCGMMVNIPNDWHKYLCHKYSKNYMQLPPENKRERHFVVKLELPNNGC